MILLGYIVSLVGVVIMLTGVAMIVWQFYEEKRVAGVAEEKKPTGSGMADIIEAIKDLVDTIMKYVPKPYMMGVVMIIIGIIVAAVPMLLLK